MRVFVPTLIVAFLGCSTAAQPSTDAGDSADACVGSSCQLTACESQGKPPTSISGIVFAPNGTLPLNGVQVYIPGSDPGALPAGVVCQRCSDGVPGEPVATTTTDEQGHFTLLNPPTGDDIPVVITVGKWRKQVTVPRVEECAEYALPAADTTLPRNRSEGDMPQIAISTGRLDAIECLARKLGIADEEITTDGEAGAVHLYSNRLSGGEGTDRFAINFPGGSRLFGSAADLWGNLDKLKNYDVVMFACEGLQYAVTKPQQAMDNVKAYADIGGRVYLSHWQNVWIEGSTTNENFTQKPATWPTVATFSDIEKFLSQTIGTIDEGSHGKGSAFAGWMLHVGGSLARGLIPITSGRNTCTAVDPSLAEQWVYLDGINSQGESGVQMFQFSTPLEDPTTERCGKVVFSDMHVSADSRSQPGGNGYPALCSDGPLTPQEKALAFMFFDISSCIGPVL